MEQIRQFRFEDFKEEKLQQGYSEVLERRWESNVENELHHHEFTADAIVIEGGFWLTVEGKTRHLNPGDSSKWIGAVRSWASNCSCNLGVCVCAFAEKSPVNVKTDAKTANENRR